MWSAAPLSIKVIAIWQIASGALTIFSLPAVLSHAARTAILGMFIDGWPGALYNLIVPMSLPITLGIGLLRLKEWARRGMIIYILYGTLTTTLIIFSPSGRSDYVAQLSQFGLEERTVVNLLIAGWMYAIAVAGLTEWFLLKRGSAFSGRRSGSSSQR